MSMCTTVSVHVKDTKQVVLFYTNILTVYTSLIIRLMVTIFTPPAANSYFLLDPEISHVLLSTMNTLILYLDML